MSAGRVPPFFRAGLSALSFFRASKKDIASIPHALVKSFPLLRENHIFFQAKTLESESLSILGLHFNNKLLLFNNIVFFFNKKVLRINNLLLLFNKKVLLFDNKILFFDNPVLFFDNPVLLFNKLFSFFDTFLLLFDKVVFFFDTI